MSNLSRKTTALAKVQASAGTDPNPVVTKDTMLLFGDGAALYTQDTSLVDDPALRNSLTPLKALVGRSTANVSMGTKLMTSQPAGASAAQTNYNVPFFDPLLRGCGWTSATGAGSGSSSTVYTPISTGFEFVTIDVLADGILHSVLDSQGSFTLAMTAGAAANLTFNFQGEYQAPSNYTTSTNPPFDSTTIAYPSDNKTLVESEALTVDGYTPTKVRSINLNWANTIAEQPDANDTYGHGGYELTARAPTLDLQFSVPNDDLTTFNPFDTLYATGTPGNIQWTHKTSASDLVVFDILSPQLTGVSYADTGGVRDYSLSYRLSSATDDGEAKITFKKSA
tara:strand:- start:5819 stop:6832 length:1014 start_codon:yes stop_codon:yes gene_type:complete